ncbi:hypothetical protein PBY51_010788 [Eleginops maclovinus]|uniref:Uncharacterized protein n=1 Tax=Eleginops maclovinus TaxID=56733 RepID=A0AAN8AIP1_ELEMC|nr:hypothetical protein PBY51_010788 [Eleginops maclovinus]
MTLSRSTGWGVAGLGLEWGQGSEIGSKVAARTGTEAHTVVGLLGRRHIRRKTARRRSAPLQPLPPHPVRLIPLPNLLPGRRGGERGAAWVQERGRQRKTTQSLQFCFLTGGDGSVNQLTEWLSVN